MNGFTKIQEIFGSVEKELLKKKNVVAVGIGYKEIRGKRTAYDAIICSVVKTDSEVGLTASDIIPPIIKGIPTDVRETGVIKALKARTDRWRPAPGGVSIGHEWITAGTLGCLVVKEGNVCILSNNHVLADSNNAPLGSPILQPGKHDGGQLIDRIATLSEFVPIEFLENEGCGIGKAVAAIPNLFAKIIGSQTKLKAVSIHQQAVNRVDAAIALPVGKDMVKNEILEIGKITGWSMATLGTKVKKSGRTTGVTEGEITQTNVTVNVQYGEGKIAMFADQLMVEPGGFSAGGDSGSAVLDIGNKLVALLFAGSDECTIVNPIDFVFADLGVSLYLEKDPKLSMNIQRITPRKESSETSKQKLRKLRGKKARQNRGSNRSV